MAELMVVGFEGTHRAAEVLDRIQGLSAQRTIRLEDAVAVYRTKSGRLRLDQSMRTTPGEGAALGGLLGVMLGALLAAPFTAGASAVVAASAIGASGVVEGVAERFRGHGGRVLRTTLSAEKAAKIQQMLEARKTVSA